VAGRGAKDLKWPHAVRNGRLSGIETIAQDSKFVYVGGLGLQLGRAEPVSIVRIAKITGKSDRNWPESEIAFRSGSFNHLAVTAGTAYLSQARIRDGQVKDELLAIALGRQNPTGESAFTSPL